MLTHVDLFSGIGGFSLAAEWAGFTTVAFCERDDYAKRVLGKHWPGVPICDDIHGFTADWLEEHAGVRTATLISGGPPCQPVSLAGKRRGKADDRYLWPAALAVVEELKPTWVCFENPLGFITLGLDEVLVELDRQGYEARPVVLPACGVGAWHRRQRLFILGYTQSCHARQFKKSCNEKRKIFATNRFRFRHELSRPSEDVADAASKRLEERRELSPRSVYKRSRETGKNVSNAACELRDGSGQTRPARWRELADGSQWNVESGIRRVSDGISNRIHRLRCLGNAVVPQQCLPILQAIADTMLTHGASRDRLQA